MRIVGSLNHGGQITAGSNEDPDRVIICRVLTSELDNRPKLYLTPSPGPARTSGVAVETVGPRPPNAKSQSSRDAKVRESKTIEYYRQHYSKLCRCNFRFMNCNTCCIACKTLNFFNPRPRALNPRTLSPRVPGRSKAERDLRQFSWARFARAGEGGGFRAV